MKITAAVTESAGAPFVLQELELGELAARRGARRRSRPRASATPTSSARPVVPDAPARGARPRGRRRRRGGRRGRHGRRGRRPGRDELQLVRPLPDLPAGARRYCHDFFEPATSPPRGRDGTSALVARRRADPRALLRAVQLRHHAVAPRATSSSARLDPARDRRAVRLRDPDRRRRRPQRAAPAGGQHASPSSAPAPWGCPRSWRRRSPAARRSSAIDRDRRAARARARARRDARHRRVRARRARGDHAHHGLRRRLQRRDDRRAGGAAPGGRRARAERHMRHDRRAGAWARRSRST